MVLYISFFFGGGGGAAGRKTKAFRPNDSNQSQNLICPQILHSIHHNMFNEKYLDIIVPIFNDICLTLVPSTFHVT
jgi:hypothetical protein